MKTFRLLTITLLGIILFSCSKDDSPTVAPPRDYDVQYLTDIEVIDTFLTNHYMTVDANLNVTFSEIGDGDQLNIFEQQDYPLQFVTVKNDKRNSNLVDGLVEDPVDYKLYYIMLNEGVGSSPSTVDSVFISYKGMRVSDLSVFDQNEAPIWLDQNNLVSGFRQSVSMLKTAASFSDNPDGTVDFSNFGNMVVFLPSGLAYFNGSPVDIGAYQCLIFQLKLKSLNYRDHDQDGIRSKDEKYGGNLNIWTQDSDGDNIPDFLDIDDDGDNFLTKIEIKDENGDYYDFDGIPSCSGDVTNPNRVKKHLDSSCH